MHIGICVFLAFDCTLSPLLMRSRSQGTDHNHIAALFTHLLCQQIHHVCAVFIVDKGFHVIVDIFHTFCFVGNHDDACFACLCKGSLAGRGIVRNHCNCVYTGGNCVFDAGNLHCGVGIAGRAGLINRVAGCISKALVSRIHSVPPGNTNAFWGVGNGVSSSCRRICSASGCR
ncbi:hypothetical protein SDC9_72603 [bioreactor metagenome]|uniref:Uncharacterized protein n=1 Tax=bioreactor metagenome TaxID=1076179 RepID=A0A644YBV1_9ZZZZ